MKGFHVAFRAAALVTGALTSSPLAGTVEGRIVEHQSGAPVAAAEMLFFRPGEPGAVAELETDGEGRFRAAGLSAGDYRIEVAKPNYAGAVLHVRVAGGEASTTRVQGRLVRYGVIAGRVMDAVGRSVRGARVSAMAKAAAGEPMRLAGYGLGFASHVDEFGRYRLYGLPPGQYAVALSYGLRGGTGAAFASSIGSGVLFYPDNTRTQLFTVSGGEEYEGVDFVIQPTRSHRVSGHVEISAPGMFSVALVATDQPALAAAVVNTEADGRFHFEGVPPGVYRLFASGPTGGWRGRSAMLDKEPLFGMTQATVLEQDVEGISIPVEKGRSFSFVLRHAAPQRADGRCPPSVRMTLWPLEDRGAFLRRRADIRFDKETVIDPLPQGRYSLGLSLLGDACYAAGGATVDLTEDADRKPVEVLVTTAGAVHGRLTGAANAGQVSIMLVAAEPVRGAAPVQITFPDSESRFRFENLRPGRYRIGVERTAEETGARWIPGQGAMVEIEVPGGGVTEVELPVPRLTR